MMNTTVQFSHSQSVHIKHRCYQRSTRSVARWCPRRAVLDATAATTAQPSTEFQEFEQYILQLQENILTTSEQVDGSGKTFLRDRWTRDASNPNAGKSSWSHRRSSAPKMPMSAADNVFCSLLPGHQWTCTAAWCNAASLVMTCGLLVMSLRTHHAKRCTPAQHTQAPFPTITPKHHHATTLSTQAMASRASWRGATC